MRPDVGWSLATTRSVFEHRAVLVGGDREALTRGLAGLAAGNPAAGVVAGRAGQRARRRSCSPAKARSGWGWARQLYERFPAFADAFDEAARGIG